MAVSIDGGGGDRRKPLSADLNLVPYIDLLTCMVAFLLITAVWTQLATLQVTQKGASPDTDPIIEPLQKIAVIVHEDGFNVIVGDTQKPLPRKAGELDYATLAGELEAVKNRFPDRTDAEVISADGIVFDSILRTMDTAVGAGFPALSLFEARPGS
jgi:biopolymer transport protein ExbD